MRAIVITGSLLVAAAGLAFTGWSTVHHFQHITVSRTTAVVAAPLSAQDCANGHPLEAFIAWNGRQVRTENDGPPCNLSYAAGQRVTVYVGSDGPADVGPNPEWILDPSSHDPFDFIDPNQVQGFAIFFGLLVTSAGIGSAAAAWFGMRPPRWVVTRDEGRVAVSGSPDGRS